MAKWNGVLVHAVRLSGWIPTSLVVVDVIMLSWCLFSISPGFIWLLVSIFRILEVPLSCCWSVCISFTFVLCYNFSELLHQMLKGFYLQRGNLVCCLFWYSSCLFRSQWSAFSLFCHKQQTKNEKEMLSERYLLHNLDHWAWVTSTLLCLGGLEYEVCASGLGFWLCCSSCWGRGSEWVNIFICIFFLAHVHRFPLKRLYKSNHLKIKSVYSHSSCFSPRDAVSLFVHHWALTLIYFT